MTRKISTDLEVLRNVDVAAELDIGEGQETEAMRKQPGLYAWYAVLASKAKKHRECMEAELSMKKRAECADIKVTEAFIEALLRSDEKWQKARETELVLADLRDAFAQRADMLQSAGAMMRTELQQNVSTLKKNVAETINKRR